MHRSDLSAITTIFFLSLENCACFSHGGKELSWKCFEEIEGVCCMRAGLRAATAHPLAGCCRGLGGPIAGALLVVVRGA